MQKVHKHVKRDIRESCSINVDDTIFLLLVKNYEILTLCSIAHFSLVFHYKTSAAVRFISTAKPTATAWGDPANIQ